MPSVASLLTLTLASQLQFTPVSTLTDIEVEPGFKSVELRWDHNQTPGLQNNLPISIKYCENQVWGEHQCRNASFKAKITPRYYSAEIQGLKMATKYNFYIKRGPKKESQGSWRDYRKIGQNFESRQNEDQSEDLVVIETKGFKAEAKECTPSATVVEIETGPNFGGKISTEGSSDPACSVQGTKGETERYILKVDHEKCGSTSNSTTSKTYIVVQENLPILTHSTRRFLIVCRFKPPDVFTVNAGLNIPPQGKFSVGTADPISGDRLSRRLLKSGRKNDLHPQIITADDYDISVESWEPQNPQDIGISDDAPILDTNVIKAASRPLVNKPGPFFLSNQRRGRSHDDLFSQPVVNADLEEVRDAASRVEERHPEQILSSRQLANIGEELPLRLIKEQRERGKTSGSVPLGAVISMSVAGLAACLVTVGAVFALQRRRQTINRQEKKIGLTEDSDA